MGDRRLTPKENAAQLAARPIAATRPRQVREVPDASPLAYRPSFGLISIPNGVGFRYRSTWMGALPKRCNGVCRNAAHEPGS